jgi:hypothetical protein
MKKNNSNVSYRGRILRMLPARSQFIYNNFNYLLNYLHKHKSSDVGPRTKYVGKHGSVTSYTNGRNSS